MLTHGRSVLHKVDEASKFFAAIFLWNQMTEEIWTKIYRMWLLVYLGPLNYIVVDPSIAYISKEVRQYMNIIEKS